MRQRRGRARRRRRSSIRSTPAGARRRWREALDPADIVRTLTGADPGRDHRQLHLIDRAGRIAAHTGAACIDWCGHRAGDGYSVAGNMLAGPRVLDATAAAFEASRRAAVRRAADRRDGSRRGRRRRQARQAGRRADRLHDRILSGARPARRRPRRAASPNCGACTRRASSDSSRSSPACRATTIRPASTDRAVIEAAIERFQAARSRADAAPASAASHGSSRCAILKSPPATHPRIDDQIGESIMQTRTSDRSNRIRSGVRRSLAATAPRADAAHRARRGSRRARSDARAHVRRPHRVRGAVRQAVRHRREARHRPAARDVVRMVGGQQGADAQDPARRHVPRRREARRRRGQVQHRAPQDDGGLESPRRARAGHDRRRRRSDDRAPQSVGAVRAAAGAARRPRRHDGLAEGRAGRRRQVRRQARVLGPVPLRRARRAGPHRARALSRTTGTRARSTSTASSTCRSSIRRCASPTCKSGQLDFIERLAPSDVPALKTDSRFKISKITEIGYQGITINVGKSDLAQKNPLGKDPRVREAFELALDRDGIVQVAMDGEGDGRQPVGRAEQRVLREEHAGAEARRRAREGAAARSRRAEPELHADDADDVRRAEDRAGRAGDGQGGGLRREDPVDRVRDVARHGRQGPVRRVRARLERPRRSRRQHLQLRRRASSRSTTRATASRRSTRS